MDQPAGKPDGVPMTSIHRLRSRQNANAVARLAPVRVAPVRVTTEKFAFEKSAFVRFAPAKYEPDKDAPLNRAFVRIASMRFT